jgi:hypothetical protein
MFAPPAASTVALTERNPGADATTTYWPGTTRSAPYEPVEPVDRV